MSAEGLSTEGVSTEELSREGVSTAELSRDGMRTEGVRGEGRDGGLSPDLRNLVRDLMEAHWDHDRGFSVPNPSVYPHLWLWDSCFHAIIWAHLRDPRATRELTAVLDGQLPGGLVPHMRFGGQPPDAWLGPLPDTSSLAQPPMFGHAARVLRAHGVDPGAAVLERAWRGLDWLWEHRRTDLGLLYVVHPWEAGNDHSPRWDDWGAPGRTARDYDRAARTAWNKNLMGDITFDDDGAASWSSSFVACPAAFNAYVGFNMAELAQLTGDTELAGRARSIGVAMDEHLWDEQQQLWSDRAVVGGGPSVRVPISDGMMGALVTGDPALAAAALDQLDRPDRFRAPFGPTNVARTDPSYDAGMYWRGAAWPHLNYLLRLALCRWGRAEQAAALAQRTAEAATVSGWAEYWNPETGPRARGDPSVLDRSGAGHGRRKGPIGMGDGATDLRVPGVVGVHGVRGQHRLGVPLWNRRGDDVGRGGAAAPQLLVVAIDDVGGSLVVRGVLGVVEQVRLLDGDDPGFGAGAAEGSEDDVQGDGIRRQAGRIRPVQPGVVQAGHQQVQLGDRRRLMREQLCGAGAGRPADTQVARLQAEFPGGHLDQPVLDGGGPGTLHPGVSVGGKDGHRFPVLSHEFSRHRKAG